MTGIRPERLRIDGRTGPLLGVDDRHPVLSWGFAAEDAEPGGLQTAFQVEVTDPDGRTWWDSGVVESGRARVRCGGPEPAARQRLRWRVRVRDEHERWSPWSGRCEWELGLLTRRDWGTASWIAHPDRGPGDPLPIFAKAFTTCGPISAARLHLCGLGVHAATLNGRPVTDEVLAPGNSNYQRSAEHRVHDVRELLLPGANVLGVALGHGTAHVHRHGTRGGARDPYSWWTSTEPARGELLVPAHPGADRIRVPDPGGHPIGGTVTIGTRDRWESRQVVAADEHGLIIVPPLEHRHPAGAPVEGSGDPVAQWEPTAGAAVSPRLIARLELTGPDGRRDIVSGPDWRTALGPAITDNWFSGTDHDARRAQPGWDEPGADHTAAATRRDGEPAGWVDAIRTTPPNGGTELVWRRAQPVRIVREWRPVRVRELEPGRRVFDLGQNLAGWPRLRLPEVPAGTVVALRPGESLAPDGSVDQTSIRNDRRGTDVLHTYTAAGLPGGETWQPVFQYFAMRFVEVTAPPEVRPEVVGLQLRADAPRAGSVRTSDERVDRLHRMAHFSVASNLMSVLTDCPGREKLAYGADYTHPMGVLSRHFDLAAYLPTMQRHLAEGQSGRGPDVGNVALKAPVYDWGYRDRFGDEVNWGNAIVLVPWLLHRLYDDAETMARHYPAMTAYLDYLRRRKAHRHLVVGELGDWVAAEETAGELTGTWGYHATARAVADVAAALGNPADAREYGALAEDIARAFHERFYLPDLGCYSGDGTERGATQAAQAMPLDAGIVPVPERPRVLAALVERVRASSGPLLRAGHLGLGPVVRVLRDADRDELLWEALHQDAGYGAFFRDTPANPGGLSTVPEQWDLRNSLNHMILTQLDEWFHTGLAGLDQAPGSTGFRRLRIRPKVVGDLRRVEGHHTTPAGRVESRWCRDGREFTLTVRIPPNTTAEVHVPGRTAGADLVRDGHGVFELGPGERTFRSTLPRSESRNDR
ncbi:family 78 glycoside hydrolase catalytic domain [Saccharopolyspora gregorii]|uniref:alpha-L-rhamnosidase n=1 Tax=Saccharopolyspora gregorii TaxID=33914 RepID=A0ABP6RQ33_9PSEU